MQKLLFLACILLFILNANAQFSFAPHGAKWHYTIGSLDQMDDVSCVTIECVGDTVVVGDSANIFEVRHKIDGSPETIISHEYIKLQNDTTFYYNPSLQSFIVLYNFNAVAGDTITVHASQTNVTPGFFTSSVTIFKYVIEETDSVLIHNQWKKRQKIVYESGYPGWRLDSYGDSTNNQIIEGIGATSYFFGWSGMFSPETWGAMLRCYSDSVVSYQNPEWQHACDYTKRRYNGLSENLKESSTISIYPNPAHETIQVKTDGLLDATYTIVNAQGKTVLVTQTNTIDVSDLPQGFYFLVCQSQNQIRQTTKFSKQ